MAKYQLPPNHPLLQNQTLAELTQEMFEDLYTQKAELEHILEKSDANREQRDAAFAQLAAVDAALGEQVGVEEDPLVAQWERDLEEGRVPDLDAQL